MSVQFEVAPESPIRRVAVAEQLNAIHAATPDSQYCQLENLTENYKQANLSPEDVDLFIAYAAEQADAPLLVRAMALEVALRRVSRAEPPEFRPYKHDIEAVFPFEFGRYASFTIPYCDPARDSIVSFRRYAGLTDRLAEQGGISPTTIFPWHEWQVPDASERPDKSPALALLYLTHVEDWQAAGRFESLAGLAGDIKAACPDLCTPEIEQDHRRRLRTNGLVRFAEFGADHNNEVDSLISNEHPETSTIAVRLGELHVAAKSLANIFPREYRDGVLSGVRELLANSLYALNEHHRRGDVTDVKLPLNDKQEVLPLTLLGNQPLHLLESLQQAIKQLKVSTMYGPAMRSTNAKDFAIYRFFSFDLQSSLYIRPFGAEIYNNDLEYGRPGEGVEASISFVTDPTPATGRLLEIGKHRRTGEDNRISIRLDREGRSHTDSVNDRDPTRSQGMVSLDVGSIVGADHWLGTRIGRFLAWGNVLRSAKVGVEPRLNHVTHYFDESGGEADTFGGVAIRFANGLEASICPYKAEKLLRYSRLAVDR